MGQTHLEGAWRAMTPPEYRYQTVERTARMEQAFWGGYVRHNELFRQIFTPDGKLVREESLFANDAIMMYNPLLPEI